jgi:hypothetical protein
VLLVEDELYLAEAIRQIKPPGSGRRGAGPDAPTAPPALKEALANPDRGLVARGS